jgi:hypothetical protein
VNPTFAIPVSIDGAGTVAAFLLLIGSARTTRAARAYVPGIVGLMVVVSAAANFLSAQGIELTGAERGWVSVIPPVSLALVLHMVLGRAVGATSTTSKRPVNRASRSSVSAPLDGSRMGNVVADVAGGAPSWAAMLGRIVEHDSATGSWPTGPTVSNEWLGGSVSRKTGSRLVAAARATAGE